MPHPLREELNVRSEKTVLVQVQLPNRYIDADDPFGELRALAETAGAVVVGELIQRRQKPKGKTYLGKGKVDELSALVKMTDATLVAFDNDLSPSQIRSIEEIVEVKIIDRSELILDIFAGRASTHLARLQVEIAQLEYTYPRLRAMWDHLGQIAGGAPVGIGTRGPGEQQIEIDRRLARRRLGQLRRELLEIQGRKSREVVQRNIDHFTVGLVGYTNAGKSTLFNYTTAGGAYAEDKLFATLSTRIERWDLGGGNHVLLSDTVGFIRDLPHHLVASFKSTLEETVASQLLLILLDVTDPNAQMQLETVQKTLDDIGATDQPRLLVLTKMDLLEPPSEALVWLNRFPEAFPVSSITGDGIETLGHEVFGHLVGGLRDVEISVPFSDSRSITYLEQRTEVRDRIYEGDLVRMAVTIGRRQVDHLLTRNSQLLINGRPARDVMAEEWPADSTWDRDERDRPHERLHPAPTNDA